MNAAATGEQPAIRTPKHDSLLATHNGDRPCTAISLCGIWTVQTRARLPPRLSLSHKVRAVLGYPSRIHGALHRVLCATNIQAAWCMCSGGVAIGLRQCDYITINCSAFWSNSFRFGCTPALLFWTTKIWETFGLPDCTVNRYTACMISRNGFFSTTGDRVIC